MSRQIQITAIEQKIERLQCQLRYLRELEDLEDKQDQKVQTEGKV